MLVRQSTFNLFPNSLMGYNPWFENNALSNIHTVKNNIRQHLPKPQHRGGEREDGRVGGSTAWRLPPRLTVPPSQAPWRPLTPGSLQLGQGRLDRRRSQATGSPEALGWCTLGRCGPAGGPTGGRWALGAQARAQPAAAAAAAMSARPRCRSPAVMSSGEPPPRRPIPAPGGPPGPQLGAASPPRPTCAGLWDAEAGGGRKRMHRAQAATAAALLLPARRVPGGAAPGGCAWTGAEAPGEGGERFSAANSQPGRGLLSHGKRSPQPRITRLARGAQPLGWARGRVRRA